MQIFSQTESGQWIHAAEAERGLLYRCPECGGSQRLRGGLERQKHFYHVGPRKFCRQRGKGALHQSMQHHLCNLLPGARLEVPLGNRIADIVWEKIIFEVQCAPIRASELLARNSDYLSQGYRIVWLLYTGRYGRKRPTRAERALQFRSHYFFNDRLEIFDTEPVDLTRPLQLKGDSDKLSPQLRARYLAGEPCFAGDALSRALQPRYLSPMRIIDRCIKELLEITHR